MKNLLKRLFLRRFPVPINNLEAKCIQYVDCPLCGTAKVNVRIPYGSATNLRGITYAAKHEITPVENAVDKKTSI
jgi:hypothetical protein